MKKHFWLIVISSLLCFSCKKGFLEVIDKTVLLRQGYVVDLTTTQQYLTGVYRSAAGIFGDLLNPEIAADNIVPNGTTGKFTIYQWAQKASPGQASPWYNSYKIIRDCNFVIEKAREFRGENATKADRMLGEALAIRAWTHFMLVNTFAQPYNYTNDASHPGIPYILTSDIDEKISRQKVSEVYAAIINDLNLASSLLPFNQTISNKFEMNYQATKALLARIYLFKGDYEMAKQLAVQIATNIPLLIITYPKDLHTVRETEALFQVMPLVFNQATTPTMLASRDIAELYRSYGSDKRNAWVRDSTIGKLIVKFPVSKTNWFNPFTDYRNTILRSTEMVLIASECYANLSKEDSARYYINQIKTRAGIPSITAATTGTALMDSIRIERRKEMAFDGFRMFDLLRWKQGVTRNYPLSSNAAFLPYPSDKAIWPIPVEDVEIGRLQQNPGY